MPEVVPPGRVVQRESATVGRLEAKPEKPDGRTIAPSGLAALRPTLPQPRPRAAGDRLLDRPAAPGAPRRAMRSRVARDPSTVSPSLVQSMSASTSAAAGGRSVKPSAVTAPRASVATVSRPAVGSDRRRIRPCPSAAQGGPPGSSPWVRKTLPATEPARPPGPRHGRPSAGPAWPEERSRARSDRWPDRILSPPARDAQPLSAFQQSRPASPRLVKPTSRTVASAFQRLFLRWSGGLRPAVHHPAARP